MKTRQILLILFSIIIIDFANGQDTTVKQTQDFMPYKWRIGAGAGFTTGFGLSFKYQPKKIGVQLNMFPYLDDYGKKNLICVGLTLTKDLWRNNNGGVFLYLANSFTSITRQRYYSSDSYYTTSTDNTGFGIGYEQLSKNKRLAIGTMIGYAQYDSLKQLLITGEIAIHYLFSKKK